MLGAIAAHARTEGGASRILHLVPRATPADVASEQAAVAEARRALDEKLAPWPLDAAPEAREWIDAATRPHAQLEALELHRLAETLDSAGRLRRALDPHAERWPEITSRAHGLVANDPFVAAVRAVLDERGELRVNATPALRRIRHELQSQRQTLLSKLEGLLRGIDTTADAYVTLRGDRFVIPVRSEHAGRVRGIVHDRSSTGATLFVEPLEVLDANNELQRLRADEEREIRRILGELTAACGAAAPAMLASLDAMERIDAVQARALWASEWDAAAPGAGKTLRLFAARHPVLAAQLAPAGSAPVPLDLDLASARILVLTGPNAGGKTVALKTAGLLALLHQAGIPIPADPSSELPVYGRIVADIGDEQSIESAESTFSSHLRHVVRAVRAAGPATLVLVDELMAGTDPEEGAALAMVVLRRLASTGATALVTTHLAALKLFAHTEAGLANAAMAFDPASRSPLYRLQFGVPGSSNAFATAARLGLPAELLDEAQRERGESAGRLESTLAALEDERRRLEAARTAAQAAEAETRRIREDHAQALADLTAKRRTAFAAVRREAEDLVAGARARIENAVRDVRQAQASKESIRDAHREVQDLEAALRSVTDDAPPEPLAGEAIAALRPGDRVWVRSLGREGILEEPEASDRARVRCGNVTFVVTPGDVQRVAGPPRDASPRRPQPTGGYTAPELPAVSSRLDLRGLERAAALEAVEGFLDRLLLQGTHQGEIVHGKGTGVLRQAVQEYLARRTDVQAFRLGEHHEGGTGVTIVTLR